MGIEPFLLASTLELIVAQRLVRKICDQCRYSETVSRDSIIVHNVSLMNFFTAQMYTLYKGKGCPACNGSGYAGRTALFECIQMTSEMESLTMAHPSGRQIAELARAQGSSTMFEDGLEKVFAGVTTLEELLRVAPAPEITK